MSKETIAAKTQSESPLVVRLVVVRKAARTSSDFVGSISGDKKSGGDFSPPLTFVSSYSFNLLLSVATEVEVAG
jgi:hypothetical protein